MAMTFEHRPYDDLPGSLCVLCETPWPCETERSEHPKRYQKPTPTTHQLEIERKRLTVKVVDLMHDSFQAHQRGDGKLSSSLLQQACELDVQVVSVVQGGIMIGEIPNPEHDFPGWADYVMANREGLYRLECDNGEHEECCGVV